MFLEQVSILISPILVLVYPQSATIALFKSKPIDTKLPVLEHCLASIDLSTICWAKLYGQRTWTSRRSATNRSKLIESTISLDTNQFGNSDCIVGGESRY